MSRFSSVVYYMTYIAILQRQIEPSLIPVWEWVEETLKERRSAFGNCSKLIGSSPAFGSTADSAWTWSSSKYQACANAEIIYKRTPTYRFRRLRAPLLRQNFPPNLVLAPSHQGLEELLSEFRDCQCRSRGTRLCLT